MKLVIFGASGMLGHKMVQGLSARFQDTWWTISGSKRDGIYRRVPFLQSDRCVEKVDATDWPAVGRLLEQLRPDAIVNCVGVIKQRPAAARPIPSITVNSLFPHQLANAAAAWGGRVIHFSTDCVFSGARGNYTEDDASDADDLYGRTKFLGEVAEENALTLRTSIIGRELQHHQSLLDWFLLSGHTRVVGYRRVWWSGVTTNHLADLVGDILKTHSQLAGLYQVSSGRISKYELLCRIRDAYGLPIEVEPADEPVNDRTLAGAKLGAAIQYHCPPWDEMIQQLVNDTTPYVRYQARARG